MARRTEKCGLEAELAREAAQREARAAYEAAEQEARDFYEAAKREAWAAYDAAMSSKIRKTPMIPVMQEARAAYDAAVQETEAAKQEARAAYDAAKQEAEAARVVAMEESRTVLTETYLAVYAESGGMQSDVWEVMVKLLTQQRTFCTELYGL